MLYTVMPPEALWDGDGEGAGEPGARAESPVDLFLGFHEGIPVWAQARWAEGGWQLLRLVTTEPALYLLPALAPGARLPAW